MPKTKPTLEQIQQIVEEVLGVDAQQVVPEAKLIEDLGADSLDIVELVVKLEDQFQIEIEDDELDGMTTVGKVLEFIQAKA
jgi:acyl carrier protein